MADITCKDCGTFINILKAEKGIVICPNCETENDCSEQIYSYASQLMASAGTEAAYRAAADAFSKIEGYNDADVYRDNCLEQASICFKDATFLRAKTEMMKGDRAGLSFACHLLESISGWKDADEQLSICRMRLESIAGKGHEDASAIYNSSNKGFIKKDRSGGTVVRTRVKNPSDVPPGQQKIAVSAENKTDKKSLSEKNNPKSINKKLTKIIIASCAGLFLIGVLCCVYFFVIAPMLRFDKAMEMIEAGNYADGYAILTELGREDEIENNKNQRAEALIEKKEFEKAYALYEEIGSEDKITDNILKRVSELVANACYSDAIALLAGSTYESLPEKRYNRASMLIDEGNFDEAIVLLASNNFEGSEQKKSLIKSVSPELFFLGRKVGDIVEFGKRDIDGNTENGKEALKWKIIDERSDSFLLLCSDSLGSLVYDGPREKISWTVSTIRKVLNLSFYADMFGEKEKSLVAEKTVTASANPKYSTDPGDESTSMLFLLSCDELEKLVPNKSDRVINAGSQDEQQLSGWWLRTPGSISSSVTFVGPDGEISYEGAPANVPMLVRPAVWVKKP